MFLCFQKAVNGAQQTWHIQQVVDVHADSWWTWFSHTLEASQRTWRRNQSVRILNCVRHVTWASLTASVCTIAAVQSQYIRKIDLAGHQFTGQDNLDPPPCRAASRRAMSCLGINKSGSTSNYPFVALLSNCFRLINVNEATPEFMFCISPPNVSILRVRNHADSKNHHLLLEPSEMSSIRLLQRKLA